MLRRFVVLLIALLALALPSTAYAQEDGGGNLLSNGGFSAENALEGWGYTAWTYGDVFGEASVGEGEDGGPCALVAAYQENDARLTQEVKLEKNKTYRLSARVKFEGEGRGNLSIMNTDILSPYIADTNGEWADATVYFRTDRKMTQAEVALRVGYFGQLEKGTAWFDDVSLVQVEEVPSGFAVPLLRTFAPVSQTKVAAPDKTGVMAIVYAALFVLAALMLYSTAVNGSGPQKKVELPVLGAILGVGLVLRVYLAWTQPGFEVDINCFAGWGSRLLSTGPVAFYDVGFCDYPPGYLPILALQSAVTQLFGFVYSEPEGLLVLKLPAILCDLATCVLLFRIADKALSSPKWGLAAAALYALCPAVLADGAAWGQIDSVLTLLMVLSLYKMIQRKMLPASVFFCIGVLIKPQALMFGPMLLLSFLHEIYDDKAAGWKRLGICFAVCAGIFALVALPFNGARNPSWLLEKYFSTMSSYPYATVNAMNLFALLGGNWADQSMLVGPFSAQVLGSAFIGISIVYAMFLYLYPMLRGRGDRRTLLISALVLLSGVFSFGVRMHERYLFPALAVALAAFLLYKDRRFLFAFLGLSAGQALNIMIVLAHQNILQEDSLLMILGSLLHIASTLYLFYVGFSICVLPERFKSAAPFEPFRAPKRSVVSVEQPTLTRPGSRSMRFSRVDVLLMTAVTVLYAALAFFHLGDTAAPETSFRASDYGEMVLLDFGEEREITRFYHYGDIPLDTHSSFSLAVEYIAQDGASSPVYSIAYEPNTMFSWKISAVAEKARYARVLFSDPGLAFFEIGFTGDDGVPYPAVVSEHSGYTSADLAQDPSLLIDEQRFVPEHPSYRNSMYFDEIYHARTAYEHIHGIPWYESTHPPLGKVFMSWCVMALGMNPFAWRLAGTMAGVLMLPGMYLLAKVLFKRTELSFAAMLLMAVDCMHLTQTRIATIDSFPVLFIIWAFFFMFLYTNMSFYHEKLSRTLPPLFASGIFMGLACASKWIGIYAAMGLAAVFFYTVGRRALEYAEAKKQVSAGNKDAHLLMVTRTFWRKLLITGGCCLLFFVVIPLGIYCGSYYQYLLAPYAISGWRGVWNYQTHMLTYHSGVFDTHPYQSTWYQWPVIWKPMAFYFDYRLPAGWSSSISTFGNPAVWWAGLAAIAWTVWRMLRGDAKRDPRILLVVIGFAAQYLPWVIVPRTTYIYHYFASVPFIILAICFALEKLLARGRMRYVWIYLGVAVLLFALFYPVASGMEIPIDVVRFVNWLPEWRLYWG